jgi:uroporphyrinogen-III synthase
MRLLLTRPEAESQALRDRLTARGHGVDVAPLLAIRRKHDVAVPLDGVTALLFTSANGLRAFCDVSPRRDFTVYAVGPASALAARAEGFADVHAAGGNVELLAALVRARHSVGSGALLHAAGSARAGDLQALLQADGYDVRRCVLYDAETAIQLPDAAAQAFGAGAYDGVLFFSPRTAATFVTLAGVAGIADGAARATAFCLSAAVADAVRVLPWGAIAVAASPGEDDLLALLQDRDLE